MIQTEEITLENRNDTLCNACGEFVGVDHLDASGYHKPAYCDAFDLESVFVEGRLWFDKTYGNTYFSNRVWINGAIAFEMPMQYGYDEQYVHSAIHEKIPSVWEIRDEMGIHFYKVATYGKKSELFKGARG
jgi:hypothetical protein